LATHRADRRFKHVVGEVEIVELAAHIVLLLTFLDLLSPESAVHMDELVYLVRNQTPCDPALAVQFAKNALESLLGIVNHNVFIFAKLDRLLTCWQRWSTDGCHFNVERNDRRR